jgi:hypothetical protein
MGMEATRKPLCGLSRTPESLAGEIRPPRNSPARVPPCVEVGEAEVHAAARSVLLEWDKARPRSLAQRVGVDAKALGRAGEIKPSVLLTLGTEAGDDAVGYTIGKPVEQIIDQRQWVGAVGVRFPRAGGAMPVGSHRLSGGKPSNAPAEQANPPRAPLSRPPGGSMPTATAGSKAPRATRTSGSHVDLPLGAKAGGPPPGSTRGSVKPKAEPPSGRPREGEFSSPVTTRRTARRASRPFLPSATSSPRPPQDRRARPSRIMPRGTPSLASTQLHRPPRLPSFVFHQLSHTLAARSLPTLTLHLAPPCTFVLWWVEEGGLRVGAKRRGGDPLPQGQAQSHKPPASGRPGCSFGGSAYRRTPWRTRKTSGCLRVRSRS